jgi:predicted RNA-binding protein YlxR (DUF448 family)
MCVACRTSRPKRELIRIVRTTGGFVGFDPEGHANGRGAYLCRDGACWESARSRGALERALEVTLLPEMKDALAKGPDVVFATPDLLGLRADILIAGSPRPSRLTQTGSSPSLTTNTKQGGARGQE